MMHRGLPRICITGPLLGGTPGWVVSQGQVVGDKLRDEGVSVLFTSPRTGRLPRLVDTVSSILRWKNSYDVLVVMVFSGKAFGMADLSSQLGKWLKKPVILWLHGGALPQFAQRHPRWVRRTMVRGDRIVAPSPYLRDHFERLGFHVQVISNVIDVDAYPFRHRNEVEPRLLWMRTFHPLYRPEMALETVRGLAEADIDVRMTMAGQDRGLQADMIALATKRGVADRISFPGFLAGAAKMDALRTHDIYISTPRIDNTGVSTLEAAASGLPIVATNVGGVPKMLTHDESALLVPDGDAQSMTRAVTRLLRDPDLTSKVVANAREVARQSDWNVVGRKWLQTLEGLAS